MFRGIGGVVRRSSAPRFPSAYSTTSGARRESPHAEWYSQVLPSMLPIALLGSTVYIALQLAQSHLSRERYLDEARTRVEALEHELEAVKQQQKLEPSPNMESTNPAHRSWFSRK